MNEIILKTCNLSKTYSSTNALSNVSITLEKGKIYGLIGQNGAGKTTLMRIISGLGRQTGGTYELFGKTSESEIREQRKRIGCMIEYPSLIGNMTAKENIGMHRVMKGMPDKQLEDELLKLVGLKDAGRKKAKNFSLGMKQRLGIADALIGSPELLILDEPINGLDPIGVLEVRNLLKDLCWKRNITILISSHNLPELYKTASDYIILHKGAVKESLTLEELEEKCRQHIVIGCKKPEELVRLLETKLHTSNYKVMPDRTVQLYDYLDQKDRIAQMLYENGIIVSDLALTGESLENYYINTVGGGSND
jgi:ABC-2 type transport system ATP-binding protein